ncbi:unnamed protein product, partial [Mesorhabditis belari]|uniref:Major facilitator superfamily (MFS) profile domain-containing protein n=1 Tax=Mesorhabditis belari TaxID=2138241 RepID=A0AAF3EUL9_9BILA
MTLKPSCFKDSRTILLIVVYIGLFLDYILMQVVVPILPEYLLRISHPDDADFILKQNNLTDHSKAAERHRLIESEGVTFSVLYGSKALVQLIANPLVGPLTNRIGYPLPLFLGFVIMTGSTVMFAFGESYTVLLLARALQGAGSACTATAGMGMLAEVYTKEKERSRAMGIALGAVALGGLLGPPYGGTMYQLFGKELPFLLLAGLGAIGAALQLWILPPKIVRPIGEEKPSSIRKLLADPYISISLFGIFFTYLGWAEVQPAVPLRMIDLWGATAMERGLVYLPCSLMYLVGTNSFGPIALKMGRWLASFSGLLVLGAAMLFIPFVPSMWFLTLPFAVIGLSIGLIDAALYPLLGYLVEIRHQNVYGSIYALADSMYCISMVIGPFSSGKIVETLGFHCMTYVAVGITLAAAPLMLLLRKPPILKTMRLTNTISVIGTDINGIVVEEKEKDPETPPEIITIPDQ